MNAWIFLGNLNAPII